jgi:hypothetical protein
MITTVGKLNFTISNEAHMNGINHDILREIRAQIATHSLRDSWSVSSNGGARESKAWNFVLSDEFSEKESNDSGPFRWQILRESSWEGRENSPLSRVRFSTEDRNAWIEIEPLIRKILENNFGISWTQERSWTWIKLKNGDSFAKPVWNFEIFATHREFTPAPIIVCQSKDPRLEFLDPFRDAKCISPKFCDGSWSETETGFKFSCWSKKIAEGMKKLYKDCSFTEIKVVDGGYRSYKITFTFPDMKHNSEVDQ